MGSDSDHTTSDDSEIASQADSNHSNEDKIDNSPETEMVNNDSNDADDSDTSDISTRSDDYDVPSETSHALALLFWAHIAFASLFFTTIGAVNVARSYLDLSCVDVKEVFVIANVSSIILLTVAVATMSCK
jgi:hypothetical protein